MSNVKVAATIPRGTQMADSEWMLASDLAVEVEHDGEYVIVNDAAMEEYGHGSTKKEAVDDLLTLLVDLCEALSEQQPRAQLGDELPDKLDKLNSLLVKEE